MSLSRRNIILIRLALAASVVAITWLATTKPEYEVVEQINDKVSHILAFIALSFLLDFSFPDRRFDLRDVMVLLGFGLLIECIQYFIPYRSCSLLDLGADGIGIALYGVPTRLLRNSTFFGRSRAAADEKVVAPVGIETASPKRGPVGER
jgi:VanZ family protein